MDGLWGRLGRGGPTFVRKRPTAPVPDRGKPERATRSANGPTQIHSGEKLGSKTQIAAPPEHTGRNTQLAALLTGASPSPSATRPQ